MRTVRVATYNLYLGADVTPVFAVRSPDELAARAEEVLAQVLGTDFPARAEAVARVLVRERVDLVGLQEVARWSRGTAGTSEVWLDFLDELLEALARAGVPFDVHARTRSFQGGASVAEGPAGGVGGMGGMGGVGGMGGMADGAAGVGGPAEMEVVGHNVVLLRRGAGWRVVGERTGDFTRTLDIVTPMPGLVLNVARSWGWVDVEADGSRFRFVNTHLEAWDAEVREAQRDELLATIGSPDLPVVVVGDFNEVPTAVGMPGEYVDAWAAADVPGTGSTCGQRADLTGDSTLDVRIDYVWVRGLDVAGCAVAGAEPGDRTASGLWPSDHACVVAELVEPA